MVIKKKFYEIHISELNKVLFIYSGKYVICLFMQFIFVGNHIASMLNMLPRPPVELSLTKPC
jgi:hypothetical protein